MTKPAFTPGPWSLRHARSGFNPDIGIHADGHANVLAEVFCEFVRRGQIDADECKANALLIAAAPDLYEALQALLEEVDERANRTGWAGYGGRQKARAALRKADGDDNANP